MLASNNMLFPSNGEPSIVPSQDIVLGLYYATREAINGKGEGMMFPDVSEVIRAYDNKEVELATRITVRIVEHPKIRHRRIRATVTRYETTVGRAILSKSCPRACRSGAEPRAEEERNFQADQHLLPQVRSARHRGVCRQADAVGLPPGDRAGISICVDDMLVPPQKVTLISTPSRKSNRSSSSTLGSGDRRRALQQGGRHLGQDEVGKAMMDQLKVEDVITATAPSRPGIVQRDLHDGRLRRPWFGSPDSSAGRYAWPDGEAGRLDHRNADYRELPRRPERSAVLHLDPRCP
jgi:DNA-directed RNA polymerase subunit beta'